MDKKSKWEKREFFRIGSRFLYADIVRIGDTTIRIGTFPGISKHLKKHRVRDQYVIVLPPFTSDAGDNYTGEEFVLWNRIARKDFRLVAYIGFKSYVRYLYCRLKLTINQVFTPDRRAVRRQNRLKSVFRAVPVRFDSYFPVSDTLKVYYGITNIEIYHKNSLFYSWRENCPSLSINEEIKKMLRPFKRRKLKPREDSLMVMPLGRGNGFTGRSSNFLIHYGNRMIWIDPMAEPFLALKRIGLHWNKITDYFISHIHEDHIEGFSALLKLALLKNKRINLITTKKIFRKLERIYSFLFPDFQNLVNHINIIPDSPLPYYHGYLTVRLNHHVLKSGTLGLKVRYKGNCFALSGDTYYSEELEKRYPDNPAFSAQWYKECHLVFHEAEFFRRDTVHTHYKELIGLQSRIRAPILAYHNSADRFLMPGVRECRPYVIRKGKVIFP